MWQVNLDPVLGTELDKARPAVVVCSDSCRRLSQCLVVPLTTWKDHLQNTLTHVRIPATKNNGLERDSAAVAGQIRAVDFQRFMYQRGRLSEAQLQEIGLTLMALMEVDLEV